MKEKRKNGEESPIEKSRKKARSARKRLGFFLLKHSEKNNGGKFKNFMSRFDRICCFIGLCILHDLCFAKDAGIYALQSVNKQLLKLGRHLSTKLRLFSARNGIDLSEKKERAIVILRELKNSYVEGFRKFFVHLACLFIGFAARFFKCIFGSLNYIAPIMSALVLFVVVSVTLDMTFALEVNYNGETIGYISDEAVFDTAEKEVLKRIAFEDYIMPEQTVPEFKIKPIKDKNLSTEDDITNEIIKASGNELSQATGLYVNNEFIGALSERETLLDILDEVKEPFRTGDPDEQIEFVKDVDCRDGIYPTSSVIEPGEMEHMVTEEQSQQRVYTTVAGDSPILIAQKNGVPYSQLKALNPNIEKELFIGQELIVEKAVPMLEVKVVKTVTQEEDINFKIKQIQDTSQYQGYVKVTQPGQKGRKEVTYEVTYVDGIETNREMLSSEVIEEPVTEKVIVGGKRPLQEIPSGSSGAHSTSDHFIWPVKGGYVSCLFGNAGYYGHTGLDIAAPYGTPVMAAASGTVVRVRYDTWSYGYHIIIDHGGNVQTLYAHNSQLFVKVGDWVEQGQTIAAMGRTGNATGNHCHFEVRINGKYMDPANYIGLRCPY